MTLFETERLLIKSLEKKDLNVFTELFSDLKVLELIPQKPATKDQIRNRFNENLALKTDVLAKKKCFFGIFEKQHSEMIGLSLFLINDENEQELGYRFKADHWGRGYGTETTKGMLDHYFKVLRVEKVTADVNIDNVASVKILEKFMRPEKEFFNQRDNCTDRRYAIRKHMWLP